MKEIAQNFLNFFSLSGYRFKSTTISLGVRILSISLALIFYGYLVKFFPPDLSSYSFEIGLTATLLLSIVIIIPLQESIETYLKKRFLSEYLFEDPLILKSARRRFEKDALVRYVFPDMVKMSGSKSGRLAILGENEDFEVYTFSKGKRRKVKPNTFQISNSLIGFLKEQRQGVSLIDTVELPDVYQSFLQLKSDFILPFVYREKVFGFLSLTGIPQTEEMQNLVVLAGKSALAIYNHLLSSQVAIHAKYKKEFEVADRIEDLIFTTKIPEYKNFSFEYLQKDPSILMEFFKNDDDSCLFILLALKGNRKLGSGMVSSHMLGKLYSQSLIKKKHSMQSIKSITEEALKDVFWHEGYEIIMGEFNDQTAKITFNQKGLNFKVTDEENPSVNLISVGWRYTLDIKKVDTIYIYYKNEKVLSIKQK